MFPHFKTITSLVKVLLNRPLVIKLVRSTPGKDEDDEVKNRSAKILCRAKRKEGEIGKSPLESKDAVKSFQLCNVLLHLEQVSEK